MAVVRDTRLLFEAMESVEGKIADAAAGEGGFGYDPVFFYASLNKTFAQLSMAEKSRVSHRGKALQQCQNEFEKILKWIDRHMPEPEMIGCQSQHRGT